MINGLPTATKCVGVGPELYPYLPVNFRSVPNGMLPPRSTNVKPVGTLTALWLSRTGLLALMVFALKSVITLLSISSEPRPD